MNQPVEQVGGAQQSSNPVAMAAAKAGGIVQLSLKLGMSRGAASQWKRIPAERVIQVEQLTGISREILRPDLYPVQQSYTEPREQ